jgi:hypothetical protein
MKRTIILIAMIAVSLVAVASADPTMSVSQQPVDVGLNDTFTAEVTVDPEGGEIYGASYDLYFDVTILEAVEQTQGDFLSHGGVETIEYVNEINNTRGKITYVETRTGNVGGATEPGLLASITFKVIGTGISDLTLADVQFVDLAEPTPTPSQEPFQIYGRVCYDNGSSCSTLAVSITNLNTSEKWDVDTSDSYYQITRTSGIDLNATEVLRFNATDGMNINVTDHTVTADDVNTGGLFNFNLTISTVKIGDVNGDGDITSADAAIALRMAVSGEYSKMADVNGDNYVTSLDALMIQQAAVDHITL